MKNLFSIALLSLIIISCGTSYKQIGSVNMISTRNVETKTDYVLISSYTGDSDKEIKKSEARSIEQAINEVVKTVPGGEFLMNVKIYSVEGGYYAVSGDVYGYSDQSYKGFKVGDKVMYYHKGMFRSNEYKDAIIKSLKSETHCLIILDEDQKVVEVKYEEISKSE